ncbi:unnamed protein product [Pleuronectes platessa]|uniref:Uncharacterized protein n=1 Tax=Pleuronectes platessa TaxID=8262 RepID=A0A9N7ZCT8_PLEPL|nr:unnamed protein product [Pleuronectes platessa]
MRAGGSFSCKTLRIRCSTGSGESASRGKNGGNVRCVHVSHITACKNHIINLRLGVSVCVRGPRCVAAQQNGL